MQNGVPDRPLDPKAVRAASSKMLPPSDERHMEELLGALCDPTRVKIVLALSENNVLAAGDLAHVIGRSRSATSQHLKVLKEIGAVSSQRDGNIVRYTLAPDVNGEVIEQAVSAFERLREETGAA